MSNSWSLRLRKAVLIGLVIALALGLRLYRLGHENFWIDEVYQVQVASQSLSDLILNFNPRADRRHRDQAPLSFLITHFFVSSEDTERTARLPSAFFGTLGVLALFVFSLQLFSYRVALLAALFLALSPLHLWYSQEARWYAQWSLITTLSYVALLHVYRTRGVASWVSYGVCTLFNIYTFVYSFLIIALQAISAWWLHRQRGELRRFLRKFVLVHFLVACAATPVLWLIFDYIGVPQGTPRPATAAELPYTFFAYAAGFSSGPPLRYLRSLPNVIGIITDYPIILVFFAVFLPIFSFGIHRVIQTPLAPALLLSWLFGLPILVFLIGPLSHVTYQVRYTFASLPAFDLILAVGALSLKPKIIRWSAIGAVLLCSAFSVANFYWNARYNKEDVRAAVAYINARAFDTKQVISIGQIRSAAEYYGTKLNIVAMDRCDIPTDRADFLRKAGIYSSKTVWILVGRDWDNQAVACLGRLSQSYAAIDHQSFTGVELWLLKLCEEDSSTIMPCPSL
jgi:mannosyltransferase